MAAVIAGRFSARTFITQARGRAEAAAQAASTKAHGDTWNYELARLEEKFSIGPIFLVVAGSELGLIRGEYTDLTCVDQTYLGCIEQLRSMLQEDAQPLVWEAIKPQLDGYGSAEPKPGDCFPLQLQAGSWHVHCWSYQDFRKWIENHQASY